MRILKVLGYFFSFKWMTKKPLVEADQPEVSEGLWSDFDFSIEEEKEVVVPQTT